MHRSIWPQGLFLKSFIIATLASLMVASACTEEPRNRDGAKSIQKINRVGNAESIAGFGIFEKFKNSHDPISIKDFEGLPDIFSNPGEQTGVGSVEEENLKQANLRKPIDYGIGAGGITMDTTFAESKLLLTPPFRGPFANGLTFYNEQLIVIWKDEGDRKPAIIIPTGKYLGKMEAGKFGQLDFQRKFKEYKGDKPEQGAARLIRELYLELEQVETLNYDCLATNRCTLIYGAENQANMVMVFPGAVLLLAKEEFQLAEIRIIRDVDAGMLANNLDILTGDILVPNEQPFQLGQTYKEIFERLNASPIKSSPEVYVRTDFIGYLWNGFWYSFHRSNYDLNVAGAEETDRTKNIEINSEFPALITMNGAPILMDIVNGNLSISLMTGLEPEPPFASMLTMSKQIPQANSLEFMQELGDFLKAELSNKYDTVTLRTLGHQNPAKVHKELTTVIQAFNSSDLKGIRIVFQLNEEQEKLSFLNVTLVDNSLNPFNKTVLPTTNSDLSRDQGYFTELSGIKMNDAVLLTDTDALGRQEATVSLLDDVSENLPERVSYLEQSVFNVPVDNRPAPRVQSFITPSVAGLLVGVQTIASGSGQTVARVVSVTSDNVYGKIQSVCGFDSNFFVKIGMTDDEVLNQLLTAIAAKEAIDPKYKCDHIKVRDDGSLGLIREIYFPSERLVLNFSNRALSSVSIYLPLNEIDPTIPEVAQ